MDKEKSIIFTKEFDETVSKITKIDYYEIQKSLEKLSKRH